MDKIAKAERISFAAVLGLVVFVSAKALYRAMISSNFGTEALNVTVFVFNMGLAMHLIDCIKEAGKK